MIRRRQMFVSKVTFASGFALRTFTVEETHDELQVPVTAGDAKLLDELKWRRW